MPEEIKKPEGAPKKEPIFSETEVKEPVKTTIPREFIRKKRGLPKILILAIVILIVFSGLSFLFAYFGILKLERKAKFLVNPPIVPEAPTTIPAQILDTDGDGLTDEEEHTLGTNVNSSDTDNDGLFDFEEVRVYQTDPLNPDTDNDGYQDGQEVKTGYNPKDPVSGAKLLDLEKEIEKLE